MKLKFTLLSVLLLSYLLDFGQTQNDSLKATYSIKATLADKSMNKASGNEKSIFGGYINGVADLLSTNNGSLNLQGSLRGIYMTIIGRGNDTLDYNYTKHVFVRNMVINLGATPNKKQIVNIDTMNFGLTYSIFNNKIAKGKVWKQIKAEFKRSKQLKLDLLLTQMDYDLISKNDIKHSTMLENFMKSNGADTIEIYRDVAFRKQILEFTGVNFLHELFSDYNNILDKYSDIISKQLLWTVTANGKYDLTKSYLSGICVSSTISKVFYSKNKKGKQYSFQLTPSYTKTADTLEKSKNTNRDYFSLSGGFNFKFCKRFETNLLGSWKHIVDGLYSKEKIDQFALSLTPRIMINKNFWLPITVKYDISHPQFFGFLSIQYSLK